MQATVSSTTTCHVTRRARVVRSHHRTSCAHGPAHAVTTPPPRGNTAHSTRAGAAERSPRADTTTARPRPSTNAAATGGASTRAGAGPGIAPGQGGISTATGPATGPIGAYGP